MHRATSASSAPSWRGTYRKKEIPPFGKRSWARMRAFNKRLLDDRFGDRKLLRQCAQRRNTSSPKVGLPVERPQTAIPPDLLNQFNAVRGGIRQPGTAHDFLRPTSPSWSFRSRPRERAIGSTPGFMPQPDNYGVKGKGFTIAGKWQGTQNTSSEASCELLGVPQTEWCTGNSGKSFGVRHTHLVANPHAGGPGPAGYSVDYSKLSTVSSAPKSSFGMRLKDNDEIAATLGRASTPSSGSYRLPSCLKKSPSPSFGIRHLDQTQLRRLESANLGPGSHEAVPIERLSKFPKRRIPRHSYSP